MRFAIWTAVSTKKQAEGYTKGDRDRDEADKESLPNQEKDILSTKQRLFYTSELTNIIPQSDV